MLQQLQFAVRENLGSSPFATEILQRGLEQVFASLAKEKGK